MLCYIPHIKALGLMVSDDFPCFIIQAYVKHVTPAAGPLLAQRT